GPVFSPRGGIVNEDWLYINGGDGFVCRVDPNDPDMVYAESQGGAMTRRNLRTGERGGIRVAGAGGGRGGFGGGAPLAESATPSASGQPAAPSESSTGERTTTGETARPTGRVQYRFNWNTPFILSNHNPSIFYCMSQFVHRSVNKGD